MGYATKQPVTAKSCQGKHDYQLQIEMDAVLKASGLTAWSSFERRRGIISIVCPSEEREAVKALVIERHPEFRFKSDEFPQGNTHFLKFNETL
jgi:hypothetical protein